MKLSTILKPMLEAKADPAAIMAIVEAYEAEVEEGKEKARARWRKWKSEHGSTNVGKRLQTRTNVSKQLAGGDARVDDKTSNLEIEPQKEEKEETRQGAFDAFWELYPNKVGKADAKAKFAVAARKVDLDTMMAALRRYVAKTDDRAWCNPSTWLHQERWDDRPAAPPQARASPTRPVNPTLQAAYALKDKLDAVTPSEIEGHHPPPRLVAISNR